MYLRGRGRSCRPISRVVIVITSIIDLPRSSDPPSRRGRRKPKGLRHPERERRPSTRVDVVLLGQPETSP